MNDVIRKNLVAFRTEFDLSSETAARAAEINVDSYRRYEAGGSVPPSDVLFRLAKTYGRKMDDFYDESPPPADPAALLMFHASTTADAQDSFEENKYREVQEFIAKVNSEIRAHRKKTNVKPSKARPDGEGDKSNKPKK